jgi:hypothetical protein
MIRFSLCCAQDHSFEGWFRSNDDFDTQSKKRLIECPMCGSSSVAKALMAPSVSTSRTQETRKSSTQVVGQMDEHEVLTLSHGQNQQEIMAQMRILAKKLKDGAEYVGDKFAAEARKIHDGEADARGIYGEATIAEAQGLAEDGIDFLPIPSFPEDHN